MLTRSQILRRKHLRRVCLDADESPFTALAKCEPRADTNGDLLEL